MLRRFFRALLLAVALLAAPGVSEVAQAQLRQLVQPNIQPIVYVSNVSYNGIPIGDDATGTGSQAAPFLTCNQAYNSAGQNATLIFNGNPASPPTYTCSATVDKAIIFSGRDAAKSAVLTGNNVTNVFSLAPTGGQLIGFQWVIIDPSLSSGGASARCIDMSSQSVTYSVNISNVTLRNWTTNCINTPSASFRGNVNIDTVTFSGGTVNRTISIDTIIAGNIDLTNVNVTVTNAQTANAGISAYIRATASGPTVDVTNFSQTVTVGPTGVAQYFGIEIVDVPNCTIDGGTHSFTTTGSAQGWVVGTNRVSASLGISGCKVRNTNITYNGAASGALIYNSTDSAFTDDTISQNWVAELNQLTDTNRTAHGILITTCRNCTSQDNNQVQGNICNVDKNNTGFTSARNTAASCNATYYLCKGSTTSAYSTNVANMTFANSAEGFTANNNSLTGLDCTGATLSANTFNYDGAVSGRLVNVNTGSSATFANDIYNYVSGTTRAGDDWVYTSTNYADLAAWQVKEPTATGTYP